METFKERLDGMISLHGTVLFVRFSLRFPIWFAPSETNSEISWFWNRLNANDANRNIDSHYVWAEDRTTTQQPYYRCVALMDGNKVWSAYSLMRVVVKLWGGALNYEFVRELVRLCRTKNGHANILLTAPSETHPKAQRQVMATRFHEAYAECIYWSEKVFPNLPRLDHGGTFPLPHQQSR